MIVYWYALIGAVLFFILSPGMLITLPNNKDCSAMAPLIAGKPQCATSFLAILVHSLIFGLLMALVILIVQYKF